MARKAAPESSDSSLSPPPDEKTLAVQAEADITVKTEVNGRKREAETTVKSTKRARKVVVKEEIANGEDEPSGEEEIPKKRKRAAPQKVAKKLKVEEEVVDDEAKVAEGEDGTTKVKVTKKRTKKQKPEDIPPLEPRTAGHKLRVGAHVSAAGGVHNSITNLLHIGANAFALFLKSQRTWKHTVLDPEHATIFLDKCKSHGIDTAACCLPHGSYLVNLAHPDEERKEQAYKSFHDDLTRCHKLGIQLYNFHPGNMAACTREEGIKNIADAINRAHKDPTTGSVIPVLETMATRGNTIGGTFEDLRDIISHVEDKSRVGVCLDTCHVFAAGYDLRTPESFAAVMEEFDSVIGLEYLKALHVNDSKAPLGSFRDLHARIGTGYLGLRAFHNLVNDERLHGLPMVLETPVEIEVEDENTKKEAEDGADHAPEDVDEQDKPNGKSSGKGKAKPKKAVAKKKTIEDKSIWAREIKMLERLVGMDVESDEFKDMERRLHEEGTDERERIGGQVERKKKKDADAVVKGAKKGVGKGKGKGKKKKEESESELSEEDEEE